MATTKSKRQLTAFMTILFAAIFAVTAFAMFPPIITAHSAPLHFTVDAVPIDFGNGVFHFNANNHRHLSVSNNRLYTVNGQNQIFRYDFNSERRVNSVSALHTPFQEISMITSSSLGMYHLAGGQVGFTSAGAVLPISVPVVGNVTNIEVGQDILFYTTSLPTHAILSYNSATNSTTTIRTSPNPIFAIATAPGSNPYYITLDTAEGVNLIHRPSGIPIDRTYFNIPHNDVMRMIFNNGTLYILRTTHLHIIRTAYASPQVVNIPLNPSSLIVEDIAVHDNSLYVLQRSQGNNNATVFRLALGLTGFPALLTNGTLNLEDKDQIIGLSGTAVGMFNAPGTADVGASTLVIADTNNNRVFAANGDNKQYFIIRGGHTDIIADASVCWNAPTHTAINRSGYIAVADNDGVHILSPNYRVLTSRNIADVRAFAFEGDDLFVLHGASSISRFAGANFNALPSTTTIAGNVRAIATHRIYNGIVYLLETAGGGDFVSFDNGRTVGTTTVPISDVIDFDIDDRGVFWLLDDTSIFSEEPLDADGLPALTGFVQHVLNFVTPHIPLESANIVLASSEVAGIGLNIGDFIISDIAGHTVRQVDMSGFNTQNDPRRYSRSDFPRPAAPHVFNTGNSVEIIRRTIESNVPLFDYPIDMEPSLRLDNPGTEVVIIAWQPFPNMTYASLYAFAAVIDADGREVFEGYIRHSQLSDPPDEYIAPGATRVIALRAIGIYYYPLSFSPRIIEINRYEVLTWLSFVHLYEDSLGVQWIRVTDFDNDRVGFVRFDDIEPDITVSAQPRPNARINAPLEPYGISAYRINEETGVMYLFESLRPMHRDRVEVIGLFDPTSEFTTIRVYVPSLGVPTYLIVRTQYIDYEGAFNLMHAVAIGAGVATTGLCILLVALKFKKKRI